MYFWYDYEMIFEVVDFQVAVIIIHNLTRGIGKCVRARTHGHIGDMHASNVASC